MILFSIFVSLIDWTTSDDADPAVGFGPRVSHETVDLFKKQIELADFIIYMKSITDFVLLAMVEIPIVDLQAVRKEERTRTIS